ncbi:MAG: aldo/keto reductase [Phycisphaerae bacterium]|nr:aldo/keto reductase [Phycisphaerae bacterium]
MKMKRREFLVRSLAGVGGLVVGAPVFAQAKPATFDPYERFELARTGIKVSRLCQGTGIRGGNQESNHTRMGKEKFDAIICGGYERGIRVYDLADLYGTHPYIVPALKQIPRKDYVIISKIWFRGGGLKIQERPDANVVVERFLSEMKTDYIDLLLLHCCTDADWNNKLEKQMNLMAALKKKGVIRAHGVSCHSLAALKTAADEPWVDSVHARINPFGEKMDGPAAEVAPVLQKMHAAGKAVIGMKILGEGTFGNDEEKKNASIKYALELGCIDILNVGFEDVKQIDDFATRVQKVPKIAKA